MSDLACVILAAGLGTRMKSATAKVLHPVAGKPMIAFPVQAARELGAKRTIVVLGHQHERVSAALDGLFGVGAVEVALQLEQLGTGHAVAQALPALEGFAGKVLILYGDAPVLRSETLRGLVEAYDRAGKPLAIMTAKMADPTGYGRIVRDASGRVRRVTEEKDCTEAERRIDEINAGIYVAEAGFLRRGVAALDTNNAQKELYLTDLVEKGAREAGDVPTAEVPEEEIQGINDRVQLESADRVVRRRINQELMRAGVTIRAPELTFVAHGVRVGKDTTLGPLVELRGKTVIGERCTIEAGCVLTDARVGDDVHIKPYTVITESTVGRGAQLGPFAHLRPGSELADDVHVGNFVETKKTRIGKGSKANHLTYLGDALIGEGCNVGAGTITCNYDGVNKEETVLEDGVFIGSDTQLVAPVRVGKGAYVGAGTTVTEDVPPAALALSRVKQVNKEGLAPRLRERALARKREKQKGP